jgi:L-aspartate oxidase
VASAGVNGANRLASNSLLECLVFGRRAAASAAVATAVSASGAAQDIQPLAPLPERPADLRPLTNLISAHLGLLRNGSDLALAQSEVEELWPRYANESTEWRNRLILARLMFRAAALREESRGVHRREEFPDSDNFWLRRIAFRNGREPYFLPV